ncbi:MAG: aminodeoxychorismate lyase [Gammaproteobacteria bacterium]|nr:aminodeoxychorismate lyase [Gammaproteobacteria bacterium]
MILVNGKPEDRIAITDRGLQYGDGLFETIAYRNGIAEFLQQHLERLLLGCEKLGINFTHVDRLKHEVTQICDDLADNDAVIKIIITRGSGGRGYFANADIVATSIVSSHPLANYPEEHATNGVAVRFCQHRLSDNVQLAGIKHLNRLDQVLARNEWTDPAISEGLMSNADGNIVEGTMSNLFIVLGNKLITPLLTHAGIAGIIRARLIAIAQDYGLEFEQRNVSRSDITNAQELFVCNSVIGIWPVRSIETRSYPVGPITQLLQILLSKSPK